MKQGFPSFQKHSLRNRRHISHMAVVAVLAPIAGQKKYGRPLDGTTYLPTTLLDPFPSLEPGKAPQVSMDMTRTLTCLVYYLHCTCIQDKVAYIAKSYGCRQRELQTSDRFQNSRWTSSGGWPPKACFGTCSSTVAAAA